MKTKKTPISIFTFIIILFVIDFFGASAYSREVSNFDNPLTNPTKEIDSNKKTILIIADNDGTEMFDMMAPFYLFNSTDQANVYIVSEHKAPIVVKRGLLAMPHFTFKEIDSLNISADVLVVPNQSRGAKNQKKSTVNFIKRKYTGTNRILSVCDGSATVAATGLYDGKNLTTHSSDYAGLKKHFKKPNWVLGTSVTQSGNLFSTAGVANATEGSLTVINELFGRETMLRVMRQIHYPYPEIRKEHQNLLVQQNSIYLELTSGKIKKTENIGVLLQNGISEFDLAAILDCYYRSFPSSLNTFIVGPSKIVSKYGLTLLATGDANANACTELHVLMPETISEDEKNLFKDAQIISYDNSVPQYMIDTCLKRISTLYGEDFMNLVKLMLDYNN